MMLLKGIEEEVYAGTPDGDILGLSPQVASALDGFVCEPDARNLEYTTSPAIEYGNVQAQLQERRDTLGRYLAENGYDPTYGARPLRRLFQRSVLDPLAIEMLQGSFGDGDSVQVDVGKAGITFTTRETTASAE